VFTGIVEELGQVAALEQLQDAVRLTVRGPLVTSDARHGDSISVNGVCLTVVSNEDGAFTADVMAETLRRSSLAGATPGASVNLERAVKLQDRLGGHLVQGHVDGTAALLAVTPDEHWTVVRLSLPAALARYVVEKGSITVDGISLTVSAVGSSDGSSDGTDWFEVSLIPTTLGLTTMGSRALGDVVNLEVDVMAKYVEKLLLSGVVPGSGAAEHRRGTS
jgi:riboflavin synthase